jgi:hypothetical protein
MFNYASSLMLNKGQADIAIGHALQIIIRLQAVVAGYIQEGAAGAGPAKPASAAFTPRACGPCSEWRP